jgi:hypothetical protein
MFVVTLGAEQGVDDGAARFSSRRSSSISPASDRSAVNRCARLGAFAIRNSWVITLVIAGHGK